MVRASGVKLRGCRLLSDNNSGRVFRTHMPVTKQYNWYWPKADDAFDASRTVNKVLAENNVNWRPVCHTTYTLPAG